MSYKITNISSAPVSINNPATMEDDLFLKPGEIGYLKHEPNLGSARPLVTVEVIDDGGSGGGGIVTKETVGLDRVENLSPMEMPLSIPQQEALDNFASFVESDLHSAKVVLGSVGSALEGEFAQIGVNVGLVQFKGQLNEGILVEGDGFNILKVQAESFSKDQTLKWNVGLKRLSLTGDFDACVATAAAGAGTSAVNIRLLGKGGGAKANVLSATADVAKAANSANKRVFIVPSGTDAAPSLNAACADAIAAGVFHVEIAPGSYNLATPWIVDPRLQIQAIGRVVLTPSGPTDSAIVRIGSTAHTSFDNTCHGEFVGFTLNGRTGQADIGIDIGDSNATPKNVGAGYTIRKCFFTAFKYGFRYLNNIWLVKQDSNFYFQNNVDVVVTSNVNAGENLNFSACVFGNATEQSVLLKGGYGVGMSFTQCSFDYALSGFLFDGSDQTVNCTDCHFEFDTSTTYVRQTAGKTNNSFSISGGVYVNSAAGGTYSARIFDIGHTSDIDRPSVRGTRFVSINSGADNYAGARTATIPNGSSSVLVGYLIYCAAGSLPRITPLDPVPSGWYVVPSFDGTNPTPHYMQIKTNSTVTADTRFLIET